MNALLRSILAVGLAAALPACSILPQATPTQVLDPRLPTAADAPAPADWTLNVARPDTDPVRDSNRVLVRTADGRLQVHGTARWAAAAPDLLRTLLVRRLRDRQLLADATAASGAGDRLLAIDLRRFELDDAGTLEAVIVLEARLHDAPRFELHHSRLFEQRQAAASAEPGDINAAFETVLTALIDELAAWMLALPDPA
jgi:ABC-type uncharacterized transport system auxiliary subunit